MTQNSEPTDTVTRPAEEEKESIRVLRECIDLQLRKSADYQADVSQVTQADYYPRGCDTIYDIIHAKMLRIRSVMDKAKAGQDANFESLRDSAKDAINYLSFFASWLEGEIEGQEGRDMFGNKYIDDGTKCSVHPDRTYSTDVETQMLYEGEIDKK